MNIAIYTRQSIEKRDSLSLDAQQQACVALCDEKNWSYKVYSDAGFSGKDTNRPAMNELIEDIKAGMIDRVIVYKMDRISRSLLDFAGLVQLFEKHDVHFMSATEQFDTNSPMGRAMVYIIMTFAQLERETIRERVRDNWYHRAKKGFFAGGQPPYGYDKERKIIDDREQSVLVINPETARIVQEIFRLYVIDNLSLRQTAQELNRRGVPPTRSKFWAGSSVKVILKNSIYAPASPAVYRYHDDKGIMILNDLEEFDGSMGIFIGGTRKGAGNEMTYNTYSDRFLIIGRHDPLIDADIWLAAQHRLDSNINTKRSGTSKKSWLSGLMKCGFCGYSMQLHSGRGGELYVRCDGRMRRGAGVCDSQKYHRVDKLEKAIEPRLREHVKNIKLEQPKERKSHADERKLIEIDKKIGNLLSAIENGTDPQLVNARISKLKGERQSIIDAMPKPQVQKLPAVKALVDQSWDAWENGDIKERSRIAHILISKITIHPNMRIDIDYNV